MKYELANCKLWGCVFYTQIKLFLNSFKNCNYYQLEPF